MNEFDLIAQAKQRLPLSALMAQLGFGDRAKKSARCPFHEDSSASFSLYVGDDGEERWKCFAGCGQGDAIDFLAKHRGLNNADACREYIRLADVPPPPVPPSSSNPSPSVQPPFDWQSCVAALTPEHRAKLAEWRGYTPEFVEWLHAQNLIGRFSGERIAFPVHDAQGKVIACHYRRKEDGSWRYFPRLEDIGARISPLIIGDMLTAKTIFAFESQWDFCAVADKLGWHVIMPGDAASVITRGAENSKLLAGLCAPDAVVYAFGQNDEPNPKTGIRAGEKWLAAVAAYCGCKCVQVVTPSPHKDANDWTRAGATRPEIEAAIAAAQPVAVSTAPDLHTAPPKNVSNPAITLPDETDEPEAAPFPLDALPLAMATIIAAVSRTERVPPALPAVCALGVVSAAIGAGLEATSGPNRVTRANLYLLASAESGSGKSETFRLIAAPLVDHQTRLLETWKLKTSPQLQSEIRVLDKEIAALERKAAKSGDPMERERLRGELEYKLARKDEMTARAAMPCIIAQDVTTERLAVLLRDNREVVFSSSPDARKLVDNLMGRYNPGKTTDESLYLQAYSGDFVRVDRQGRDAVVLNKPCLALCWFVQPDLLGTMLDEQSLSVSGFLPRLLVCHTNAAPRRIEGEAQILSESVRDQWTQLVGDLLATFHAADKPHGITPTPAAVAVFTDFHNSIVDRRAIDLADVGAFAARYAENAWRLAVVLHAAQWAGDAGSESLTAETAANAVRVVEWFAASQLDILAKGRLTAATKVQDEVLELLESNRQRKSQDFTTAREVHRARITATADAAKALLARMEADGLLVGEDIAPAHGGKTTRIYRAVKNPVPG
jgi:hypothetical protein